MVGRRGVRPWVLLSLVVVLVGVATAVVVWWPSSGGPGLQRRVSATVVQSASCQGPDAYDSVSLTLGGALRRARLDGCGHRQGEVLDVRVPSQTSGDLLVQPADAAPSGSGIQARLSALMFVLSALAGAGYAALLRRHPRRRPAGPASGPAPSGPVVALPLLAGTPTTSAAGHAPVTPAAEPPAAER